MPIPDRAMDDAHGLLSDRPFLFPFPVRPLPRSNALYFSLLSLSVIRSAASLSLYPNPPRMYPSTKIGGIPEITAHSLLLTYNVLTLLLELLITVITGA